jgi:hypothetical protein
MVQGLDHMEIVLRLGFCVWPRNVAQVELSALVRCRLGFANSLTAIFLIACGLFSRGEASELLNNIPHLLCDPLQRTHDAQHRLHLRKLRATLLSCVELGRRLPQAFDLLHNNKTVQKLAHV